MPITLNANQVPAPTVSTNTVMFADTPVAAAKFSAGETTTVVTKLNKNAVIADAAYRYGSGSNAVCRGLSLSATTGLNVLVAAGHAIAGGLVELTAAATVAVGASVRTWIWLQSTGTIATSTTLLAPNQNSVLLGSVVTDASSVVSTDTSGVCYIRNGIMVRCTNDATAPTDTPPSSAMFITICPAGSFLWNGTRYVCMLPASAVNSTAYNTLGFFGSTPVTKTSVADPSAMTAPATMGASYTQSEVQALRTDVANLRNTVLSLKSALAQLGLV